MFGDDCEVLTVVDADGRPVSGVLSFYFRDEVLPYYAGDTTAARDLAANDFKYWDLMRPRLRARRCACSTTAAASAAPARSTSRRTGASSPRRCTTSTSCCKRDDVPQNNPLTRSTSSFIAMWRRLPLPVGELRSGRTSCATWADDAWQTLLYLIAPDPVPAQQGRQGPLVPPAQAPGGALPVHLGTFVDDPDDWQHVAARARRCAPALTSPASRPRWRACAAWRALLTERGADARYYRDAGARALGATTTVRASTASTRVRRVLVGDGAVRRRRSRDVRRVVDFVDVDSAKWGQYADARTAGR